MMDSRIHALDSSQAAARDTVRIMMHVTGWSASKLAVKSGLAASTLNRFMHMDVKHNLKFSTLSRLLITALARLNERIVTGASTNIKDVEAVVPLINQFGIDLEKEAARLARSPNNDGFWRLDAVREAVDAMVGKPNPIATGQVSVVTADGGGNDGGGPSAAMVRRLDLPVVGAAKGGADSLFFDNGAVHERIRRPPNLEGVENAFAVYMVGDSMEPRYFAGEFLYVNPNRPPARHCFVVVELTDGQGMVKQFLRRDDRALHLHQFNPDRDIEIDGDRIKSIYRVVGTGEP